MYKTEQALVDDFIRIMKPVLKEVDGSYKVEVPTFSGKTDIVMYIKGKTIGIEAKLKDIKGVFNQALFNVSTYDMSMILVPIETYKKIKKEKLKMANKMGIKVLGWK